MKTEEYRQIIASAIDKEVEAYVFYEEIRDRVNDPVLQTLFRELASEERQHRKLLENYLAARPMELHFDESRDYKVSETFDRPGPTSDMKPVDGIKLAIKREEDAVEMYRQFAELSTDPEQRKVFEQLARMELGHKARLEDLYTEMAFPEVW
ncbi:rubrerythrin [Methanofollis sp. W23]|uniref:ferritin-like domain-containing protein n=1 Tax=Methanofollis sp. W23 TaxID=2817849 RepID=UPI001AE44EB8|nr:ferritin family protein [Methanofollis sp. W23]MBP2144915.1 rubrerythrin [Methanofollis sp. W23]